MRKLFGAVFLLCATCGSPETRGVQAATPAGPVDPLPGATTHFSQGWPRAHIARASDLGTGTVRDSIHWAKVETVPAQYSFTAANSGHIGEICAAGMKVQLGIDPRNPLYDGGQTAYSPAAMQAFGRYLAAVAQRFRGCVIAIEVGNEINGKNNVVGTAAQNRVGWYVNLLRTIRGDIKAANPDIAILGGSTNTIATGFHERLFDAGELDYVDGIVIHPYRDTPEGVDREISRLIEAMARHGQVKPVWATEFSREFEQPADGAPYILKMLMLMQAAGVQKQLWYALVDQRWFPTMGLLTAAGARKPAGNAFAFAAQTLAPSGPARRIDHGDPLLFHFRVGERYDVVWGAPRSLSAPGAIRAFRPDGSTRALPNLVDDQPVIIEGASSIAFGKPRVLADSLKGFGERPLEWLGRRVDTGAEFTLAPVDWQWTAYLGSAVDRRMIVTQAGMGPTLRTSVVLRYVATAEEHLRAAACFVPQGAVGDGVTVEIRQNGTAMWSSAVGPLTGPRTGAAAIAAKRGDRIELVLLPNRNPAGDRMRYRFRIGRDDTLSAEC